MLYILVKYIKSKDINLSIISLIKHDNRIKKLLSIDLQNFELYEIEEDLIELAKFDLFVVLLKSCPLPVAGCNFNQIKIKIINVKTR